jgi:hypothetical protein
MTRLASLAVAAALALTACKGDGPTAPQELRVAITLASLEGPTISETINGPVISCNFDFAAVADGAGTAMWSSATYFFYLGTDRTAPVDSSVIAAADAGQFWDRPTIGAGETQHARLTASAGVPFSGDLVFRYQPSGGGAARSATASFTCSPPIPTGAPSPAITSLTVTPPSGNLPAGAPITITYSATAPAGLWQTLVRVTGPCVVQQLFSERMQTSASHSLSIKLPAGCQLGVPITVTVGAMDAAVHTSYRELPLPLTLADMEAPILSAIFFTMPYGVGQATPSGDYYAGDSLPVMISAVDNHSLAYVVWEVLPYGVRDSVAVGKAGFQAIVPVRLHEDWSGPIQLKLFARDAVGLTSAVITTPMDSIRMHPTVRRPTRVATISGQAQEIAIDDRRGVIYLALGQKELAVFSLSTMKVTAMLPLPGVPSDLDLTAGGDSLVIAMNGQPSLGVVDLRQPALALSSLPLAGLDASLAQVPGSVRVLWNGHAFVGLRGNQSSAWALIDVDLATGVWRTRSDAAVNGVIGGVQMERSLDASVIVVSAGSVACMRRYVVATDTFSGCVRPRVLDWRPVVDGTGQRFALGSDVYDASMRLLPKNGPDLLGNGIIWTALSADGQSLFELFRYGIIRRNAADSRILDKTPNPVSENLPAHLSRDGNTLVVLDRQNTATTIGVIDLR